MNDVVLRPRPTYALPLLVMVTAGDAGLIVMAVGLWSVRNYASSVLMLGIAVVITAACIAYFRNAALFVTANDVGKINLVGWRSTCPLRDLASIETRYTPQPTLCFMRADGKQAFRVNRRPWSKDQVQVLRDTVTARQHSSLAESGEQLWPH